MDEPREYKYLADLNYIKFFMGYVRVRILHKHEYPGSTVDMILIDQKGTTINGKIHEKTVKKFVGDLEEGRIYDIGQFGLKEANWESRPTKHRRVLWINGGTKTELIPEIRNFPTTRKLMITSLQTAVKLLERKETTFLHDLMGVVISWTDIVRYDTQKMKREVTIQDQTGASIKITLWNKYAEEFDDLDVSDKSVFVVTSAALNIFNNVGQGFTTSRFSNIAVDIDHQQTVELKKSDDYDTFKAGVKLEDWRNNEKQTLAKAMKQMRPDKLEERYTVVGKVSHEETFLYRCCTECKTKSPGNEVTFDCKKCLIKVSTQLYCRSTIDFSDSTTTENLTLFGNQLETVLRMKIGKIVDAYNNNTLSKAFASIKNESFVALLKPNVSGTTMYLSVSKIGRYVEPLDEIAEDYLHTEDTFENESESSIDAEDMLTKKAQSDSRYTSKKQTSEKTYFVNTQPKGRKSS